MTHTEALKTALKALERGETALRWKAITAIKEALTQPEHDWKDLYEKEKRKSAIWLAKYEEVAGPAPKAIPMAQPDYRAVKTYHKGEPVYVAQPEPVGRFAKFTDGIWREVTDGSAGVPLYTTPPQHVKAQQEPVVFNTLTSLKHKKTVGPIESAMMNTPPAQSQQEPVAWIHNFIEGGISIGKRPADLERHPDRWTALFKDPKPCPTCEALARTVMLDQTSHDAGRTWVGLTDEEAVDCWPGLAMYADCAKFWENIEALLKEKNEH